MAKEKKLDKEVVRDYATKNHITFEQAHAVLEAEAGNGNPSNNGTDGEE